jgi:hypothetical protein
MLVADQSQATTYVPVSDYTQRLSLLAHFCPSRTHLPTVDDRLWTHLSSVNSAYSMDLLLGPVPALRQL